MGNDGGTILRRKDVINVRGTETSKANVDASVLDRVAATHCALSRQPLRTPVVSDALGRLYNKDSVVKYLLSRSNQDKDAQRQPDPLAGHLRGLKDVRELKLTRNPAFKADEEATRADDGDAPTPFICPLTQRAMNGRHRFVYLVPCGCVMSESGLRAVLAEGQSSAASNANANTKATCPVCGMLFNAATALGKREVVPGSDVVVINGTGEEVEAQRRALEQAREAEKQQKKDAKAALKKAKEGDTESMEESKLKLVQREEKRKRKEKALQMLQEENLEQSKRQKTAATAPESIDGRVKATADGKEISAALRSLYGFDKPKQKEAWMTRGTFNRFA